MSIEEMRVFRSSLTLHEDDVYVAAVQAVHRAQAHCLKVAREEISRCSKVELPGIIENFREMLILIDKQMSEAAAMLEASGKAPSDTTE